MLGNCRWAAGCIGLLTTTLTAGLLGSAPAHAIAGGTAAAAGSYTFVAKLEIGEDRSCSGALVAPQWVVTSASCFPENVPAGQASPSGAPKKPTTAIVGRTDLSTSAGHAVRVVELVGRPDRNLVLARLATRITDITPVPIATTAPAAGDVLRVAGYGRTATEWVPDLLHTGQFTVGAVTDTKLDVTGVGDATICKGDSGGPALREADGRVELVAVNNASWQGGCYAETETRRGAVETRVDNLASWIIEKTRFRGVPAFYDYGNARLGLWLFDHVGRPDGPKLRFPWDSKPGNWDMARVKPVAGDFTGDGKPDIAAMYNYGDARMGLWLFEDIDGPAPTPRMVWDSKVGNWDWHRVKPVAGDFDRDGKTDIAAFYDYGNARLGLWLFDQVAAGSPPRMMWDSGVGNWELARVKPVAGDFNGDGTADIAAMYNYGGGRTGLWLFDHVATAGSPYTRLVWDSKAGNWDWGRGTPLAGDFNSDGKADIAAFYDYGGGRIGMWLFENVAGSTPAPRMAWDSGAGFWDPTRAQPVAGDFNDDGKTDIAAFYNYFEGRTGLWLFDHVTDGSAPYTRMVWDSKVGNWEWHRGTPVAGIGGLR